MGDKIIAAAALSYALAVAASYWLTAQVQKVEDFPEEHHMTPTEILILSLSKPWTFLVYFGVFFAGFVRGRWG